MTKGPECFENWNAANMGAVIQRSFEYPLFTDARIIGDDLSDGFGPYLIMNAVTMKRGRPALVLYLDQRHFALQSRAILLPLFAHRSSAPGADFTPYSPVQFLGRSIPFLRL